MEYYDRTPQIQTEYVFDVDTEDNTRDLPSILEAYPGCLVEAMRAVNAGNGEARDAIDSTVVYSDSRITAMTCGQCALSLFRDDGVVFGANKCPKVQTGQITLGELA